MAHGGKKFDMGGPVPRCRRVTWGFVMRWSDSGPSRAWPFPRDGQRPRERRKLHAFGFRIADESLRAAMVRAKEQIDEAYSPQRVSRSDGSVRALQDFAPELLGGAPAIAGRDDERLEARPGSRWCAAEVAEA